MPRKCIAAAESLWVPLGVRRVCYQCGSHVPDVEDKDNCRMCADVFCLDCLKKITLPVKYGYTSPQLCCRMCSLLVSTFATFASRLHTGQGGMLLPPQCAAVITACDLPQYNPTRSGGDASQDERKGQSFFSRFRSSSHIPKSTETQDAPSSYSRNPPDERPTAVRPENATVLGMVGWRPMNPLTSLVIGHATVAVRDIATVVCGESSRGASDGRVTIHLRTGGVLQFVVGQAVEDTADETRHNYTDFTTDPQQAKILCDSLATLIRECKHHFAFGRASMALHKDMCPA